MIICFSIRTSRYIYKEILKRAKHLCNKQCLSFFLRFQGYACWLMHRCRSAPFERITITGHEWTIVIGRLRRINMHPSVRRFKNQNKKTFFNVKKKKTNPEFPGKYYLLRTTNKIIHDGSSHLQSCRPKEYKFYSFFFFFFAWYIWLRTGSQSCLPSSPKNYICIYIKP